MTNPPAAKLSLMKRAAFTTLLLAGLAAVIEVSAVILLMTTRGYDGNHLLQYSFDPYKNILPTPDYVDTRGVRHTSAGFRRSVEVSIAKPSGTYRVFLMGGSTAFGTGGLWSHIEPNYPVLNNSQTIDAYLESYLATARPGVRFEVINAAIPSTWTHHSLIYLNQTILRYDPDLVLFLDGFNDFYQCEPQHDQFRSYSYGERATVIMGEPTLRALVEANGWWIARKSAAVYLLYRTSQSLGQLLSRPGERPSLDVDACFAQVQRIYPANALAMWRRSATLLRAEGVDALFLLQPLLVLEEGRSSLTDVERRLLEYNIASWLPRHAEYVRRATPWIADTARATISSVGGFFVDLTGIFSVAEGQMFTDYAHLTPAGNARLARVVADSMLPIIDTRIGRGGPRQRTDPRERR
jgi:hypothetical protein